MSVAPTLCWLAHGLEMNVGKAGWPQWPEQEPQPLRNSRLCSCPPLPGVALLSLVVPASKAMHPIGFGCCLALTVADPLVSRRHFGSAACGLSPAPYG